MMTARVPRVVRRQRGEIWIFYPLIFWDTSARLQISRDISRNNIANRVDLSLLNCRALSATVVVEFGSCHSDENKPIAKSCYDDQKDVHGKDNMIGEISRWKLDFFREDSDQTGLIWRLAGIVCSHCYFL